MRPSPKRDPQRNEVYRWEGKRGGMTFASTHPVETMRGLVKNVCRKYGVPSPPMHFFNEPESNYAGYVMPTYMAINKITRNPRVVVHELAHWILHKLGFTGPAHGREWLGLYLWLCDYAEVEPLCASLPSARAAGLSYRHPRYCSPTALKRKFK